MSEHGITSGAQAISSGAQVNKRSFGQMHLSTAIVLSLACGYLLNVNLKEHSDFWYGGEEAYEFNVRQEMAAYGWPAIAYYKFTGNAWYDDGRHYEQSEKNFTWEFSPIAVVINVLFSLGLIVALVILVEFLLRLREVRRP